MTGVGATAVLVQGVAGGGDMSVKAACALALAQLAHLDDCKVCLLTRV